MRWSFLGVLLVCLCRGVFAQGYQCPSKTLQIVLPEPPDMEQFYESGDCNPFCNVAILRPDEKLQTDIFICSNPIHKEKHYHDKNVSEIERMEKQDTLMILCTRSGRQYPFVLRTLVWHRHNGQQNKCVNLWLYFSDIRKKQAGKFCLYSNDDSDNMPSLLWTGERLYGKFIYVPESINTRTYLNNSNVYNLWNISDGYISSIGSFSPSIDALRHTWPKEERTIITEKGEVTVLTEDLRNVATMPLSAEELPEPEETIPSPMHKFGIIVL